MEATGDVQSPYTCITCRVAFRDLEIQRQHYKSDWHRYNLKRKVAELPPVPVEEFQKRVIAQRGKDDSLKNPDKTLACNVCRKSFSTKNQYENHTMSKKHKENAQKFSQETNEDSTTSSFIMVDPQPSDATDLSGGVSEEMEVDSEA